MTDHGPTSDMASSPAYKAGSHWVSSFNYDPEVQQSYAFARPVTIVDSTIRKILYTTGIRPSIDNLLHVGEALEEVGVREIILNLHWWGDATLDAREYEAARAVLARGFAFRTTVTCDAASPSPDGRGPQGYPVSSRQAVDALRDIGVEHFAVSVGDPGDPTARDRQVERMAELFSYACSLGMTCTLGMADAPRLDFDFVVRTANEGLRLGATHLELSDSYSSLSPEAARLYITRYRAQLTTQVPVIAHIHNDFGLGSAAAIAATAAGAWPDVAVNGLSYRSGFAALEEVVLALELLYGVPTGFRLDRLQRLSEIVAERAGFPVPPMKPVTGAHAFLRDLPMWVLPYLKHGPEGFPPPASCFAPSLVGSRMRVVWGSHNPSVVIRAKLEQIGLSATEEQILEIRGRIISGLEARHGYPCWLTDEEVEAICRQVAG